MIIPINEAPIVTTIDETYSNNFVLPEGEIIPGNNNAYPGMSLNSPSINPLWGIGFGALRRTVMYTLDNMPVKFQSLLIKPNPVRTYREMPIPQFDLRNMSELDTSTGG